MYKKLLCSFVITEAAQYYITWLCLSLYFQFSVDGHLLFSNPLSFLFSFWLCWVFIAASRLSPVAAVGLLSTCSTQASPCGGFACCGAWALGCLGCGSCSSCPEFACSLWTLPGPGVEPMSPVRAGGVSTATPLGMSCFQILVVANDAAMNAFVCTILFPDSYTK